MPAFVTEACNKIPHHWQHLRVFRERLPAALEERRRLRLERLSAEASGNDTSSAEDHDGVESQPERLANSFERLEQLLAEVLGVLGTVRRTASPDQAEQEGAEALLTRHYAPYYALIKLRSAIDLLRWTQATFGDFLFREETTNRPFKRADTFDDERRHPRPMAAELFQCAELGKEYDPHQSSQCTERTAASTSFRKSETSIERTVSCERLLLSALKAADAAFSFHRFRQLELEPGLTDIWRVLIWSLCTSSDPIRGDSKPNARSWETLCPRHQRWLDSLVRIQCWRAKFRDGEFSWPPPVTLASMAIVLFDALRRASVEYDSSPQSISCLEDLLAIVDLMGEIPGLGLLPRMPSANIWELFFLILCSDNNIWGVHLPRAENDPTGSTDWSPSLPLCALFYERLGQVAHQWRLLEVLSRKTDMRGDHDALYLAAQNRQLSVQTLHAVTFEGVHGPAYRRILSTLNIQLLFELGQLHRPTERAALRAELVREAFETSGQNYTFLDEGVLLLPCEGNVQRVPGSDLETESRILFWTIPLEPVDHSITAQNTYLHLLAQRPFVWRQQPRFTWLVLFLIHQIAMAAPENEAYLSRLDHPTRKLVERYRLRCSAYRPRSEGGSVPLHVAVPVRVADSIQDESPRSAERSLRWAQVYAGDLAHVVLSAVRDGLESAQIRPLQQVPWSATCWIRYEGSKACLPDSSASEDPM